MNSCDSEIKKGWPRSSVSVVLECTKACTIKFIQVTAVGTVVFTRFFNCA